MTDLPEEVIERARLRLEPEHGKHTSGEMLDDVISALTAEGYMVVKGWRPIEEAPRDGTPFDVWLGDASADDVGFYCCPGTRRAASWHWIDGKFRPLLNGLSIPCFVQPTHFAPSCQHRRQTNDQRRTHPPCRSHCIRTGASIRYRRAS